MAYSKDRRLDDGAQHYLHVSLNEGRLTVRIDDKAFPFKAINAGRNLNFFFKKITSNQLKSGKRFLTRKRNKYCS